MNRRQVLKLGAAAAALGLSRFPLGWSATNEGRRRRVLVFTRSQGFQHSCVTRQGDKLSLVEQIMTDLGKKHDFDVSCTKDGREFTPENIDKYDVFLFETTGDLTQKGRPEEPPMSAEGKEALLKAVAGGKGFVGCHCASDTFHSRGDKIDPYIRMLGGEFITHGAQQKARMHVTDPEFPGAPKEDFELLEEWYALKNFADNLHVILVQETAGMKGGMYQRPPYPATWARQDDKGRVFFTSMGHREDVWENPTFQKLLLGGLSWAAGNVKADVAPNLDRVTPYARELENKKTS